MKKDIMQNAWEIKRKRNVSMSLALKLAWACFRADKNEENIFISLTSKEAVKENKEKLMFICDSASDWWKKAEKYGIEDSVKRYGYGLLKGAFEWQEKIEWNEYNSADARYRRCKSV